MMDVGAMVEDTFAFDEIGYYKRASRLEEVSQGAGDFIKSIEVMICHGALLIMVKEGSTILW